MQRQDGIPDFPEKIINEGYIEVKIKPKPVNNQVDFYFKLCPVCYGKRYVASQITPIEQKFVNMECEECNGKGFVKVYKRK